MVNIKEFYESGKEKGIHRILKVIWYNSIKRVDNRIKIYTYYKSINKIEKHIFDLDSSKYNLISQMFKIKYYNK